MPVRGGVHLARAFGRPAPAWARWLADRRHRPSDPCVSVGTATRLTEAPAANRVRPSASRSGAVIAAQIAPCPPEPYLAASAVLPRRQRHRELPTLPSPSAAVSAVAVPTSGIFSSCWLTSPGQPGDLPPTPVVDQRRQTSLGRQPIVIPDDQLVHADAVLRRDHAPRLAALIIRVRCFRVLTCPVRPAANPIAPRSRHLRHCSC